MHLFPDTVHNESTTIETIHRRCGFRKV